MHFGITLPKSVQSPCPIWLTTNAGCLGNGQFDSGGSAFALRRVGALRRLDDAFRQPGWIRPIVRKARVLVVVRVAERH